VYINPFGSYNYYAWKKSGYGDASRTIHIPFRPNSGYTIVYIKKVFKGQLKYRTTRLYDDTWIHYCYDFLECKYANIPRIGWIDDARYDGVSADGQRATFQYGPVERKFSGPRHEELAWDWLINEWKSLPLGVRIECDACAKDGDARK
jgi:hypothetical protein